MALQSCRPSITNPLPEQNAPARRGMYGVPNVHVRRARAVSAELQVIVDDDVREDPLQRVRCEIPPRAADNDKRETNACLSGGLETGAV